MEEAVHIPTRSGRLQDILRKPYSDAEKELYALVSRAIIKPTMDERKPERRENRRIVAKYLIEKSDKTNPISIDDLVRDIEGIGAGDDEYMKAIIRYSQIAGDLYNSMPLIIRRTMISREGRGKGTKAAYYLDNSAVSAFNQNYKDTVEFVTGYKGDLKLLLLDELSRLN